MKSALTCLPVLLIAGTLAAQDVSEDTLRKLLERYPAADANKDGKLTVEEARAYRALTARARRLPISP